MAMTKLDDIVALVRQARLDVVQSGRVGMNDLNFVLAAKLPGHTR